MIFVTVGNATQGFGRLLKAVDDLARGGFFGREDVFMQTGHNPEFRSTASQVQPFISLIDFQRRISEASLIISHGGCTVFQVLRAGKVPVVMPRMKKFGEHVNDHQVSFIEALARDQWIVPACHSEDLAQAIEEARRRKPRPWPVGRIQNLVAADLKTLFV